MSKLFSLSPIELFKDSATGIVEETISPEQSGRVKGLGTHWPARLASPEYKVLHKGETCTIVGIQGITLLVQ